jgi:hypothetical protein
MKKRNIKSKKLNKKLKLQQNPPLIENIDEEDKPIIKIKKLKKAKKLKKSCETIIKEYQNNNISGNVDINNSEHEDLLKCMSAKNRNEIDLIGDKFDYLYPHKDDKHFNIKLASKKEFYDTRNIVKTPEDYKNIKKIAESFCKNTEFELEPHQMFVRNFLSFLTPYNSLLLYHGLGTGKTCSAISVCEEMRTYNTQMGDMRRIIIVASPKVQENFKIQLFDERKLKNINGLWNIKACTGNKFIKEINPMNMKGLSRIRIVKQIKKIIHQFYHFQGYGQFSNYIKRIMDKKVLKSDSKEITHIKRVNSLKKEFSNRMIVIDEIHNLRFNEEGTAKPKESSENLINLVSYSDNLKLMILSATPMFNSHTEIVWLLNLLNINDKRFPITEREIFDKNGNFTIDSNGVQTGKELLIQKATGYISYVRGENPFTFPNSIWPATALNPDSLQIKMQDGIWKYPSKQINGASTIPHITLFDLVLTTIGEYQSKGYNYIIQSLKKLKPKIFNPKKGLPYTILGDPLQALNMIYPHKNMESINTKESNMLFGKKGLARVMLYEPKTKSKFKYKDSTLTNFGKIFAFENIGIYSSKIKYILESIKKSTGIVFIYSQYIDGGAVPMALALEEIGITRYGGNSLFETPPTPPINVTTMKPEKDGKHPKFPAKYIMITGDKNLTPDTKGQMKGATGENNINGEIVKVIIVTRAGSEGLDFKYIREMHVMDPWYNYNRQKQIIGRAIRNLSHCKLPYEERNCSIFLYGTELLDNEIESADLYIYRLAEKKAFKIANVSRILKETAVDCLLNNDALNFSQKNINVVVEQKISSGKIINYHVGDRENSDMCDYTTCAYKCKPDNKVNAIINDQTYNESFIIMNLDKILRRIRLLFKEQYIYQKNDLITHIRHLKNYPFDQIYSALTFLINERNEYLTDVLGRLGRLVNIGDYYMFQPIEIDNKFISRFERVHPIDYKRKSIEITLPERIPDYTYMGSSEEKQQINKKSQTKLILYLNNQLNILKNPSFIDVENKNNWIMRCSWAIKNLVHYNKFNENKLLSYAMEHILDAYTFDEKVVLLSYITTKQNKDELDLIIDNYFNQFKISNDKYSGIVLAQFNKPESYEQYTIMALIKGKWIINREATASLARVMFHKFQILDLDTINDLVGFMINFGSQEIVFKIKNLGESEKGRSNKGRRCANGESKKIIINRINNLLDESGDSPKYSVGIKHKSSIELINNERLIEQSVKIKNVKKIIKINSLQLCTESELILRHFNDIKKNGKKWFFNVLDSVINNIEKLKK